MWQNEFSAPLNNTCNKSFTIREMLKVKYMNCVTIYITMREWGMLIAKVTELYKYIYYNEGNGECW